MGANIVRRAPASKTARQHERSPTTRMGELQLDGLMREHEDPDELEPELELRDASSIRPRDGSLPSASPSGSATRLAHTLRRGPKHVAVLSALPATPSDRPDMSTMAMPHLERPAGRAIPRLFDQDLEDPTAVLRAPAAAALAARSAPETDPARTGEPLATSRPSSVEPAADEPAADEPAAGLANARVTGARLAQPPFDVTGDAGSGTPRRADSGPRSIHEPDAAAPPRRPVMRSPWHIRLVLPITLLVVLAALSVLMRAIL